MGERTMTEAITRSRALPDDTVRESKAAAIILKELGEVCPIPVPVIKIAQMMGFQVYQQPIAEPNLSGFIMISGNLKETFPSDKIISVAQSENLGHKRFAIAHELAHFLFDYRPTEMNEYCDYYYTDEKHIYMSTERRANHFAACLLMPERQFVDAFAELKVEDDFFETVNQLAERFQVSGTAIKRRIEELNLTF